MTAQRISSRECRVIIFDRQESSTVLLFSYTIAKILPIVCEIIARDQKGEILCACQSIRRLPLRASPMLRFTPMTLRSLRRLGHNFSLQRRGETCKSFRRLQKERERSKQLINDFDQSVKEETDDLAADIKFTDAVKTRFAKGLRDERLMILHRLGQRFELRDGVLTFRFEEPYSIFSDGKDRLEAEFGSLEPLECCLEQVESGIREKATLLWCRWRDSNSHKIALTRS